jgi:flavin-binding protein dodecin
LSGILKQLKEERSQVERQLSGLDAAIRAFANVYNPQLDQRRAVMAQKIIEVVGTSKESFAKAAENAVAEAAKTVRGLKWARVAELEMELDDKKIVAKWGWHDIQDRSRSSSISGQQKMLQHAKSARARIMTTHFVGHATEL